MSDKFQFSPDFLWSTDNLRFFCRILSLKTFHSHKIESQRIKYPVSNTDSTIFNTMQTSPSCESTSKIKFDSSDTQSKGDCLKYVWLWRLLERYPITTRKRLFTTLRFMRISPSSGLQPSFWYRWDCQCNITLNVNITNTQREILDDRNRDWKVL